MNYRLVEKFNKKYLLCGLGEIQLSSEQDALDLIAGCWENEVHSLIIQEEILSDDFFNLRTGLAGAVLQKFMNYQIKFAIVLDSEEKVTGRFKEMVMEANKGRDFRVYKNIDEAEKWLLNL